MTPDRWQQIEDLLDQALDLNPTECSTFLDRACGDDPDLRREVDALLAAEAEAPDFLEQDAAAFAAPALDEKRRALAMVAVEPGHRLGAYRLLREIGHGGMSVVFLAERDDGQFRHRVALKLLRHLGGAREERIRRFRAERQILAALRHPNVAQIYDGGMTDGGWPYLVMEYVDGIPLTDYCAEKGCSVDERMALFEDVCRAVQHAHQRLVVHRDLKPSNILVTKDGRVKLLDFGIAKLLADEEESGYTVPITDTGMRLLTPQYAAPEQVRGEPITTATDVYALGVVLYEVLTGQRPYDVTGKPPSEVERIVCEQEPTKPSTAVTTSDLETVSFPVSSGRLQQLLRGDLDIIVLKALRKEPEQRYGSAQELAEDVRRYRERLPIEGRAMTTDYRLRKFVRRHRVGVAVAAAFGVLVLGFTIAMTLQQQVTARERDRAQVEAEKAREVTAFLLGLFEANEPETAPTDTITARTLLALGMERARQMQNQPEVQAEMLGVIGKAYQSLGRLDRAEPLLHEALALQRTHTDETPEAVARTLSLLGALRHDQGRYGAADSLHREALALRRRFLGERHVDVARSLNNLARAQQAQGNLAVADSLFRQALAIDRNLLGEEHPATIMTINNLSTIQGDLGNFAAAESLQRDVLALQRRVLGERHTDVGLTLNNIGYLLTRQGKFEEAEVFYRGALAIKRDLYGEEHPDVARTLANLATMKARAGDYEAAEPLLRETLALWRRIHGDRHPSVATAMNNLATLMDAKGEYAAAVDLHRRVLAMRRDLLGPEHPLVASSLSSLATALVHRGSNTEATALYREALALQRKAYGEAHPAIAKDLYNLASLLQEQRDFEEAESLYRQALAMDQKLLGNAHFAVGLDRMRLATLLTDKGDYEAAEVEFKAALDLLRRVLPEGHPRLAETLHAFGGLLIRTGAYREAEPMLQEALRLRRDRLGDQHPDTRKALESVIDLYEAWGRPDEAARYRTMADE